MDGTQSSHPRSSIDRVTSCGQSPAVFSFASFSPCLFPFFRFHSFSRVTVFLYLFEVADILERRQKGEAIRSLVVASQHKVLAFLCVLSLLLKCPQSFSSAKHT
ncbi:hypothetical protein TGVAND_201215 [Toxoplasma gondii VAND]|uniref:Uncharacterized protein n=1 Tax=Toxoplasma gondii VAND TaxID=933077 RepID=A0A086Q2Q1_TOXGO|nr:hypothetical protein TGVAND_201215 [Toxoplasma gondii VAND]